MNSRLLGAILIISTLVVMIDGFRSADVEDKISALAYLIWGIGGVCGIIGLIRLNALGSNVVARTLGFLPLIGFATFILGNGLYVAGFITSDDSLLLVLASIGWLAMLAGMVLVGIITIAAKTWRGWRRFVPLLTIMIMLVGMGIGQIIGTGLGSAVSFSGYLLLGYVITTAEPTSTWQPSVTTS